MSYVLLIGAFERDNFGDILFGKVFERIVAPLPCRFASLVGRDMRYCGGDIVFCLGDAMPELEKNPPLAVIHCGGQTLSAPTHMTLVFDLDVTRIDQAKFARLSPEEKRGLVKLITTRDSRLGYVNAKRNLFPGLGTPPPVGYFSVGGAPQDPDVRAELHAALREARFIAVRDSKSHAELQRAGFAAGLYPDVVHLLAEYFPKDALATLSPTAARFLRRDRPYLVFQSKAEMLEAWAPSAAAEKLIACARALGCDVVLQPAGVASFHDTLSSLNAVCEAINKRGAGVAAEVQPDRNVWAQVGVIAGSRCWVGTSLHGRIVSTAYARPRVSFGTIKTKEYVDSWESDTLPVAVDPARLDEAVKAACAVPQEELTATAQLLASKAKEGIAQLLARLNLDGEHATNSGAAPPIDATAMLSLELDRMREEVVRLMIERAGRGDSVARGTLGAAIAARRL